MLLLMYLFIHSLFFACSTLGNPSCSQENPGGYGEGSAFGSELNYHRSHPINWNMLQRKKRTQLLIAHPPKERERKEKVLSASGLEGTGGGRLSICLSSHPGFVQSPKFS